jgi:subtilisin family serine protease
MPCPRRFSALLLIALLLCACASAAWSQTKRLTFIAERDLESRQAATADDDVIITAAGSRALTTQRGAADLKRGGLCILQLQPGADGSVLEDLEATGARIHRYLGANAWYATLPAHSGAASHPGVRRILRPQAAGKISPMIDLRHARTDSRKEVRLHISLTGDTGVGATQRLLAELGGRLEGSSLLYGHRAIARIPAGRIEELAARDEVLSIEPADLQKAVHNARAARFLGVDTARSEFGIGGSGINVGIWDGGPVFNHRELAGRLTIVQQGQVDDHATHVAGTIAAAGIKARARGMAPQAHIFSWDYEGDVATEMNNAVAKQSIILANHSWGYLSGWEFGYDPDYGDVWCWFGDALFGAYTNETAAIDTLVYSKPITVVFSAGNDRNDKFSDVVYYDVDTEKYIWKEKSGQDGPYGIVGPPGTGKNVITVGASNGVSSMSNFSSWGPTDDGRVKPEITAHGVNLFSCVVGNSYDYYSGTSMAAPAVTGSLALLAEMWKQQFGSNPSTAALRNLIALTANELKYPGPDYEFGFGTLNVQRAGQFIEAAAAGGLLSESSVKRRKTNVYSLDLGEGLQELRVCLAWLDPAGAKLVNDLDLVLISPSGTRYYPWTLDPGNRTAKATAAVNTRDNIELVTIASPAAGDGWRIEVRATRLGKGKNQAYVLTIW